MSPPMYIRLQRVAFVCGILGSNPLAQAQLTQIQWQRSLGGTANDFAGSIQQTSDGGFITVGSTNSLDGDVFGNHGGTDCWVVKLDTTGNLEWQKALGGSQWDVAVSVEQTADSGFIVLGTSYSNDGDVSANHGFGDFWVAKLNPSGDLQWQRAYGGSGYEEAHCIQQTDDGGYVMAGTTDSNDGDVSGVHGSSDYWIVKLDPLGDVQWQKCLGGSSHDVASSVQQTGDGDYFLSGRTFSNDGDVSGSHGSFDFWVVKLDGAGDLQWQRALGGSGDDEAFSAEHTSDGGYIVAGRTTSNNGDITGYHGNYDGWVVKLDGAGNLLWQRAIGGSDSDEARCVRQTTDDGYVIAAHTISYDGDVSWQHGAGDVWVVKLDTDGNIEGQRAFGGSNVEFGVSAQGTVDGGYVVAGYTGSNDGDVILNNGAQDFWVVSLGNDFMGLDEPATHPAMFEAFPNPSDGMVRIVHDGSRSSLHLIITNASGCRVFGKTLDEEAFALDLSDQPQGLYLITVFSSDGASSRRLVLE